MRDGQVAVFWYLGISFSSVHQLFAENILFIYVFNTQSISDISLDTEDRVVNKSMALAVMQYMSGVERNRK